MVHITISSYIKIPRSQLSGRVIDFISRHLTFENPQYRSAMNYNQGAYGVEYIPEYLNAYHERGEHIYIARGFLKPLLAFLKRNKVDYTIDDQRIVRNADYNLSRIKTLRPYQNKSTIIAMKQESGVIKMPCGAGKTITLTNIIRRLKQHTLILVHTNFIMNQWINYFKENYGYDIGIIQGPISNIRPITIAMIPTLYKRKLTKEFLEQWGCIVVDETHRVPAHSFYTIVNQFPAKYRYGTTATARRGDGLTNMIFSTLGEIIYSVKAKSLASKGYLTIPKVKLIRTNFFDHSSNYHTIISHLSNNEERNSLIVRNLYRNRRRFNLVLSNRIEHLEHMSEMYSEFSSDYEVIIGKIKKDKRTEIIDRMLRGELHVIFATQLADEGLDIPNLDTIHLAYPTMADGVTEQRIGRIQRYKERTPIVYDYVDHNVSKLNSFAQNRIRLYNNLELEVKWKNVKDKKGIRERS